MLERNSFNPKNPLPIVRSALAGLWICTVAVSFVN